MRIAGCTIAVATLLLLAVILWDAVGQGIAYRNPKVRTLKIGRVELETIVYSEVIVTVSLRNRGDDGGFESAGSTQFYFLQLPSLRAHTDVRRFLRGQDELYRYELHVTAPVFVWILLLTVPGLFWVTASLRGRRQRRLEADGKCVNCGYDLRETTTRCPECGREGKGDITALSQPSDFARRAIRRDVIDEEGC